MVIGDKYSVVVRDHDGREITPAFYTNYDPGVEFTKKRENLAIVQRLNDCENPTFLVFKADDGSAVIPLADIGSIRAFKRNIVS